MKIYNIYILEIVNLALHSNYIFEKKRNDSDNQN